MSTIQGIARFTIHPGKLDEFKKLSADCVRLARQKDTGTLRYELFFNTDETKCVVHEEYTDSEACIQHFQNMGDSGAGIFAITDVDGEMWVNPSPQLRAAVEPHGVKIFTPFLSMAD